MRFEDLDQLCFEKEQEKKFVDDGDVCLAVPKFIRTSGNVVYVYDEEMKCYHGKGAVLYGNEDYIIARGNDIRELLFETDIILNDKWCGYATRKNIKENNFNKILFENNEKGFSCMAVKVYNQVWILC